MKTLKNVIVSVIAVVLLALSFTTGAGGSVQSSPPFVTYGEAGMNVLDGITTLTIAFLGIVTILDLFQAFGWDVLVPTYITEAKAKKEEDVVKKVIDTYYGKDFSRFSELLEVYFKKDLAYVKSNQQTRADYILHRLGIKRSEMLDELIRLRAMPLADKEAAIKRIEYLLKEMPAIIIKQAEDPADRTYKEVQFYIDFISSMRDNEYGKELSQTFSRYIELDIKDRSIEGVTKVVIPADSNFLLGFKVAENLDCPPVIMRTKKGRIFENRPWDGELSCSDKVIIVHDVLVTGDQIVNTMKTLKSFGVEVSGVYCIVHRLEYSGCEKIHLQDWRCTIQAMLDLNDEAIREKYYEE